MSRAGDFKAESNSREYLNQKQVRAGNPINQAKVPNHKTKFRDQKTKTGSYTRKLTGIDNAGTLTRN